MADQQDPDISRKYRELGAEEPPRALDAAILAASRRAVESRPAPLVVPTGRRRWYFPVAAAAVITLTVAVTVQLERQRLGEEVVVATAPQAQKEERAAAQVEKKQQAFSAPAAEEQQADVMRDLAKSTEPAAKNDVARDRIATGPESPPVVAQAAPAPGPARREMESPRAQAGVMAEGRVAAQMQRKAETPEASLERIAELRTQGKHEEADKALAEFRKQYPDYRISDEMKAKVERK